MRSFSVNSTPALGRQLNRHTTLGVVLCFNPFSGFWCLVRTLLTKFKDMPWRAMVGG
jgi:hypothetical protein